MDRDARLLVSIQSSRNPNVHSSFARRYFGVQGHAQIASALLTATGDTHGMMTSNTAFKNTSLFHIYVSGITQLFNYGDCGMSHSNPI
jgi:hypothetical protein